jgi:hypothetical protein
VLKLPVKQIQWTNKQLLEFYEERAAIMEFDGNMPRKQAERAAYYDWRKQFPGLVVPEQIRNKVRLSEKNNESA